MVTPVKKHSEELCTFASSGSSYLDNELIHAFRQFVDGGEGSKTIIV